MKGKSLRIAERQACVSRRSRQYTVSAVTVIEIANGFRRVGRSDRLAAQDPARDKWCAALLERTALSARLSCTSS
jgi:hypothetical protein